MQASSRLTAECVDLLLHFAGSGDTKRKRMTAFMDAWDMDNSNWVMPVNNTGIQREIADFWAKFVRPEGTKKPTESVESDG